MNRSPLNPMSGKRRAKLAAAGNGNPFSTLTNGAAVGRGIVPRLAAPAPKQRRRDTGPTSRVLALLADRSGGRCEFPYLCPTPAAHTHHRRPRRMGGSSDPATNLPSNLLRLCPTHHEWVESNRAESLRLGLLLHANDNPLHVPVRHAVHGLVYLTATGAWTALSPNQTEGVPLADTRATTACVRCTTTAATAACCTSHNKPLCHLCYRRTHFVELCVPGCRECAAEGLPVNLADLNTTAVSA